MGTRVLAHKTTSVEMDYSVVMILRVFRADGLVVQHSDLYMRACIMLLLSHVKLEAFCFDCFVILLLKLCELLISHRIVRDGLL